uniref:Uncharacterized protein n=1 Tax=Anguilla anguilla TaxID=7936 RepID=A0A0E9QXN9_ANGAN
MFIMVNTTLFISLSFHFGQPSE